MPRKRITRRIAPLPKRPSFRATDNKTELLLTLLRNAAKACQGPEPQLFYPLRDVAQRFRIPVSLGARIYRELEREGLLRCIRGSGTLLEGLNATRKQGVRGVVAIAASLSHFLTRQDYRMFLMQLDRELQKREFATAEAFFEMGETADDLAGRLKNSHPDRVVWYCPQKLSREVALRLHDVGISIIGVSDSGFPGIRCQYEIKRELALTKIVCEWKKEAITRVKVAVGPARSGADEAKVGRTLEDLDIGVNLVSLRPQTVKHFISCLVREPKFGIVILNSAASVLATSAPEALAQLARCSHLAFVDGPISVPFTKFTDANVDLVIVDWQAVAKRIVDHVVKRRILALEEPCVFEAAAQCGVPLSLIRSGFSGGTQPASRATTAKRAARRLIHAARVICFSLCFGRSHLSSQPRGAVLLEDCYRSSYAGFLGDH